jgi:hypothetical protein
MTDLETLWQRKTDDELIAAARHWEDDTEECHRVMRAELHRRGLKGFEPATAKEEDKKPDVDALRTESGRRGLSPPALQLRSSLQLRRQRSELSRSVSQATSPGAQQRRVSSL